MKPNAYWDWALYYYVGTVVLHMSPGIFWRCTPRKFNALCRVHAKMNSSSETTSGAKGKKKPIATRPDTYIDNVIF